MFNSNFRTGEGREQCAPTRYIDISLGDEARYVSGFLDIIIAFYNTIFTTNTDKAVQDLDFQKVNIYCIQYTVQSQFGSTSSISV